MLVRNISKNRHFFRGGVILVFIFLFIICGPLLTSHNPFSQDLGNTLSSPSLANFLGTDYYGRDVFIRLVYGGRTSLGIALLSTFFAIVIGSIVGLFTAYFGGWLDIILMRFVDVMLAFPKLIIILLIVGLGASSVPTLIFILAMFSWMEIARIVRSKVLALKNLAYIRSARALGLTDSRIIFKHILPNIAGPIIVSAVLLISTIILIESGLSFLGLGVRVPGASWGSILNDAKIDPLGTWWLSVPAGLLILLSVIGFNLIGDGLQKLFEPGETTEQV